MVVTSHHVPAANHDFADLACRQHTILLIPDCHFHTRNRRPNRTRLSSPRPVQSDDGCSLSLSVAFKNRYAEALFEGFRYGRRQRFASGNRETYGGKIECAFCACKHSIHGRDGEENAEFVFLTHTQDFRWLEAVREAHLARIR